MDLEILKNLDKNMIKDLAKLALLRVLQLIIPCVIFSVVITSLNVAGIMTSRLTVLITLCICALICIGSNVAFSRHYYFLLRSNIIYYIVHGVSFIIFSAILFFTRLICGNVVFTWIFVVTKAICYIPHEMRTMAGVAIFLLLLLASYVVAPVGMSSVFLCDIPTEFNGDYNDDEDEEEIEE